MPPILSSADLPGPELCAAVRDGELFPFTWGFCPIDEVGGELHRAVLLSSAIPPCVILERSSAAWVFGIGESWPDPIEVCTDIHARSKAPPRTGVSVREVVIDEDDIVCLGGVNVTTPLRTAIDLARFEEDFGPAASKLVVGLARIGGFRFSECAAAIDSRRNLPNKRVALRRLAASLADT